MTKPKIAFLGVALVAATLALGAAAFAQKRFPPSVPGQPPTIVFFVANEPSTSGRVGIFVARRANGIASLYYCSTPADALSKEPNGCKTINGFPSQ